MPSRRRWALLAMDWFCCTSRNKDVDGKKAPLVDESPKPTQEPTSEKAKRGAKWISALLADPSELASETKTRFRSVDKKGHVISGGDGLIDIDEANDLVTTLCEEVGMPG